MVVVVPGRAQTPRALLDKYCVVCHNERARTANLQLDKVDLANIPQNAEVLEKVVRKLRGGAMPPQGMPRPDKATLDNLVSWLETSLDRAAAANPNPGRAIAHRLNRTEYANAIRELLALDVDVTSLLPADDQSYGFDNIADVLRVSPVLLERYLSASREISSLAIGDPGIQQSSATYLPRQDLAQEGHIAGLPLGTRGGILVRHNFPLDAEYVINVTPARTSSNEVRGLEFPHQLEVTVDGTRVKLLRFGGKADYDASNENPTVFDDALQAHLKFRIPIKAGPHSIGAAYLEKSSAESVELLQPFSRTNFDPLEPQGVPLIGSVTISGPFDGTGPGDTPSRRQVFICRPVNPSDELPCAKKIISELARRAYRRPVNDTDLEALLSFYQSGRNKGTFDTGIELALRRILSSPEFLFRFEPDPPDARPNTLYHVNDLELASRLSFFLWSDIPDSQLLNLASHGALKDSAVVEQQVRRMLADSRSEALVRNFAGQWLYLRNLQSVAPDPQEFPDFDDNLRQSLRRETELFFGSIVTEDRSVLDLLNANYTFVDERLARHYGIPGVHGTRFRRVTLDDDSRRGLLGQGSILTVTSYANRTSPVLRGKWILENILGSPPPPPPPNVPALKENSPGGKALSVRELMEQHRANPVCANCHKIMDPLGFSLENFDAVGKWRSVSEAGTPIDASGQLADGTKVNGVADLRRALLSHPDAFVQTLTEKLLTYALGRGLEYYDLPTVRAITREAAKNNYRFSSLVMGIVQSIPFEMKMKKLQDSETLAAAASALQPRGTHTVDESTLQKEARIK
jgi:hypothetical protein